MNFRISWNTLTTVTTSPLLTKFYVCSYRTCHNSNLTNIPNPSISMCFTKASQLQHDFYQTVSRKWLTVLFLNFNMSHLKKRIKSIKTDVQQLKSLCCNYKIYVVQKCYTKFTNSNAILNPAILSSQCIKMLYRKITDTNFSWARLFLCC
jgi:hypothetical protein